MNYYPYDHEESRSLVGAAAPIPLAPLTSMPEPSLRYGPSPPAPNGYFSHDMYVTPQKEPKAQEGFAPIKAKFKVDDGEIISHDPRLNKDGEALYRFIMTHAQERPEVLLHVEGTHVETADVKYSLAQADGSKKDSSTEFKSTVTDFDFYVDIGQHICHGPLHWTVPDEVPEYRGRLYREVDRPRDDHDPEHGIVRTKRKKAHEKDVDATVAWKEFRWQNGLPPWVGPNDRDAQGGSDQVRMLPRPASTLRSSRSIQDWAHEYCKSKKKLKEFVYDKRVYGWNIEKLENAVAQLIRDSGYSGDWSVEVIRRKDTIRVRPDTFLARALAHTWVKALLWLFLLYPFVWLFKRYSKRGGGMWEVCGGAWALKYWEPDPAGVIPGMGDAKGRIVPTMAGAARMVGLREGEWFRQWQSTMRGRIASGYASDEPLTTPDPAPENPVQTLDGY
ncbi:hypothetical protein BC628DRAFT_287069 [Trametes gibbosa]|nr:hypothetical protein BC628DRAFT_287069 [Trametes gibbosa]